MTHGLLSACAAAFFLCAGWVGYTTLMEGTGAEARMARVMECRLIPPRSGVDHGTAPPESAWKRVLEWGYALELSVALSRSSSVTEVRPAQDVTTPDAETILDRAIVRLEPRWSRRPALDQLAREFKRGTVVKVRRSAQDPSRYDIVEARSGFHAFLPIFLSCLGVFCLALSLRFSPAGMQRLVEDELAAEAATNPQSMNDLLHPHG